MKATLGEESLFCLRVQGSQGCRDLEQLVGLNTRIHSGKADSKDACQVPCLLSLFHTIQDALPREWVFPHLLNIEISPHPQACPEATSQVSLHSLKLAINVKLSYLTSVSSWAQSPTPTSINQSINNKIKKSCDLSLGEVEPCGFPMSSLANQPTLISEPQVPVDSS